MNEHDSLKETFDVGFTENGLIEVEEAMRSHLDKLARDPDTDSIRLGRTIRAHRAVLHTMRKIGMKVTVNIEVRKL